VTRQQQPDSRRPFPPRLWNIRETADFLGVPVSRLYYWSYRCEGPRILRVGRSLRYNPYEVIEWATSRAA